MIYSSKYHVTDIHMSIVDNCFETCHKNSKGVKTTYPPNLGHTQKFSAQNVISGSVEVATPIHPPHPLSKI